MAGLDVVTFGEVMGLFVARHGEPLRRAREFRLDVAGAEATVAVGLARFGHRAGWCGRVGDDPFGHAALDALRAAGVDLAHAVIDPTAPTGLLVRDAHPSRRISVQYRRSGSAASRLHPDHLPTGYLADARLLHVTGITPALSDTAADAVRAALDIARAHRVPISFDPNVRLRLWTADRAAAVLGELVAGADLVLTSTDEARLVTGRGHRDDAAKWLLDNGSRLVVVKDGARGAWATDGTGTWSVPAHPVTVLDPVGAGDAFDAGFLSGWLDGLPVPDCLARAAAAGACSVQSLGDLDGLPYRTDLPALTDVSDVDR